MMRLTVIGSRTRSYMLSGSGGLSNLCRDGVRWYGGRSDAGTVWGGKVAADTRAATLGRYY